MSQGHADTIVACITGQPPAGVALLRVSGPRTLEIVSQVALDWADTVAPRFLHYTQYTTGDDGLVAWFEHGHNFTGELSAELSLHGSHGSIQALLDACVASGARLARPGEFSLRAFLNGRYDLTQAEAIKDTVDAVSEAQLRAANRARSGELGHHLHSIRHVLVGALARVEASTDFSEEVGPVDSTALGLELDSALQQIDELLAGQRTSEIIRSGARIALVGLPNAGKSSLLNALLGSNRAIVTPEAGTTRDVIEVPCSLNGLLCFLNDTAGLREADVEAERIGVSRSRDAATTADLVLYVYDSALGLSEEDRTNIAQLDSDRLIVVANKRDLGSVSDGVPVSALTGQGLEGLASEIAYRLVDPDFSELSINPRHAAGLSKAREAVVHAQETNDAGLPTDLIAVDLQTAIRCLAELTGELTPPNVLEEIFARFCIGK